LNFDTPIKIKFNNVDYEPLFFEAFLIDINQKKRISETISFDFNSEGHLNLLKKDIQNLYQFSNINSGN
jgi:hypothetical protein